MFSVIIPLYNKEKYIERCLQSVINQSYKDFEIIVVDDGSTNESASIIKKQFPDKNVNLIQQPNQGVSAARNKGIDFAKQPYIAFLDADDYWHLKYLESMHDVITNEKQVTIIGAHYTRTKEIIDDYDTIILDYSRINNYFNIAIKNTLFSSSSTVINKSFFDKNEGFNIELKRGEDIDVWLRASLHAPVFYINNTLVYYSDEDINQTTRVTVPIEQTLVGNVFNLYRPYFSNKVFYNFINKYVYFNLFSVLFLFFPIP